MSLFSVLVYSRLIGGVSDEGIFSSGWFVENNGFEKNRVPKTGGFLSTTPDAANLVVNATKQTSVGLSSNKLGGTPTSNLALACPQPTGLTLVSATGTTATLQWTAGSSETQWEIVIQDEGYGSPTGGTIIPVTNHPFTVSNLSPLTGYEFYVRAVCSASDVSAWSGPFIFYTTCDMFPVTFREGFNSISISQQCWTVSNVNGDADSWNMDWATTPIEGNQSASILTDGNNGNNNDWLISPKINLNSSPRPKRLRFLYKVQSATDANDFKVMLSTTGSAVANFTQTIVPLTSYSNTTYAEKIVNLVDASNNPLTGAVYIAWNVPAGGLDGNRLYIDDVIVEDIPTCPNPTNLTASSMGYTSATLNWTPGYNETKWEVIALPTGSTAPNATSTGTVVNTPPPYVMNGLLATTTYDFYVRAVCSTTDVSTWLGPVTATTLTGYDQCSMPLDIPASNTNSCTVVRNMSMIGSTVSPQGGTCGTNNSGDVWFQFRAINPSHTIDLLNFTFPPAPVQQGVAQPIALTLYSGTCGSLTQIACSLNNSITATGLQVNTVYLVRASINTTTTNLNVKFDVCVKTPPPPSNGSTLNCMINTVNYDFELPVIGGTGPSFPIDHTMLGWRTTAPDHVIEVWPAPNYENHPAYSGRQFIELNGTTDSEVYQDYATPTTTVFSYGFAHKGRWGVDIVELLAGPPGGPYTSITTKPTGAAAWAYYTGTYVVPNGQPVTRFIFKALDSSNHNKTVGNFLDAITFTADNSIISASPYTLDCNTNTTTVTAAGMGIWSADSTNPAAAVIANTTANTTAITGFTVPGTYKFKWTTLYCVSEVVITYINNGNVVPSFTQVAPVCSSAAIPALPTTSINGVTGTWSPAINNMATTTYTFTPNAGQCASAVPMTITVNPGATPTFTQVAAICPGDTLAALPTTSIEGIAGTWSPALNNMATTNYIFTPTTGQCASAAQMTITVNPGVTPSFTQPAPICSGGTLSALPTTSNNGITGTWAPALNNTATTVYTFTPTAGQCASAVPMTITVDPKVTPSFTQPAPICSGSTLAALPTTSNNGITGTWAPALNNTATTNYTFTPDAGQCAIAVPMTITVDPIVTPTFTQPAPICSGSTLSALPTTSNNGITGVWTPALNNTATTNYTFTPDGGQCASSVPMTITVNQLPTVTVNDAGICTGDTATIQATVLPAGGTYSYAWTVPAGFPDPGNVPSFTTTTLGSYSVVVTNTATNCSAGDSGNVTANSSGGNLNLHCGGYNNDPDHPNAIYMDWSNLPGITSFNYSYSIAGGPVVTGSQNAPSSIYIVTNGQPITFTVSGVGSACVAPQTVTCGCPSPMINAVPNVSACSGQSVNQVNFATSDAFDTISWTNSNPAIGLAASGTSNFIPSFTAATVTTPQTATITVVLTKFGCTGPARTFTITINPLPTVTVNDPVTCSGINTTVTAVPGTAGTYNYAWTVPAGFPDPGNVASFPTSTAGTYSVVITNSVTGCVSASDSGTVTVNPLPSASIAISGASTICTGTSTGIAISGTPNATVNYTINGTPASVTIPASGGPVNISTGILSAQTTYQLTNVTAGGCTASLSQQFVVVNIAPQPTASISGATSVCFNSSADIKFEGTAGATVGYTVNSGAIQTVVLGAGGTATVSTGNLTANATYTLVNVTAATAPNCVQQLTGSVTVTVVQTPTVTDPGPQTLCSGQSTGIRLQGPVPNTTFTWTYTQTGGVTGASNGSGNIISQVLTSGTASGTVTYTITPAVGSCIGTPITVTVTVNPVPVVNVINAAPSICTGGSTNITMSSTIPSATFSWNVTQTGSVTGATSGTGSSINQLLTASGTTVGQAVYTIIPYINGCQGAPKTVTVTVYPKPTITASPSSTILCSGGKTNIVLNSNVPNTVYTWTALPNGVFGALSGTGNIISQTLTTAGSIAGTVTYTITSTVNGCTGNTVTATVTVNPTPEIFSDANPPAICSGDSSGITVNPNIVGTSISWTVVQNGVTGASDGSGSETTPGAGIPIGQILTTTGNAQGTVIYTITPINNGCAGDPKTVTVRVNPTPKINIPDGLICVDATTGALMYGYPMNTGLSEADYDFQWYFENNMNNVIAMTSSYTATKAGMYTVSIMNAVTGCTDVFMIEVKASNPATTATAVVTNYFEDTQAITVTVAGNGSYLYSLDGGAFQTSNVFVNVLPGEHTVTIHDEAGCTDITLEHIVTIGYPRFFTPNGDGYNDTWNIWSLSDDQPNAEIHIFDRYGKLIKQIVPGGNGWDGLFNGQNLPSTDYWFTVKYKENGAEKLFKAHFSMKR